MISQMNWFWAWVCSLLLTKTCKSLCWCPLQLQCLNLYSPEQYVQMMCVIAYFWQKLSVHGSLNIFLLPYINNNSKNIFVWVMFTYIIKTYELLEDHCVQHLVSLSKYNLCHYLEVRRQKRGEDIANKSCGTWDTSSINVLNIFQKSISDGK